MASQLEVEAVSESVGSMSVSGGDGKAAAPAGGAGSAPSVASAAKGKSAATIRKFAILATRAKMWKKAKEMWSLILKDDESDAAAWYNLAGAEAGLDDARAASAAYDAALALEHCPPGMRAAIRANAA